MTALQLQYRNLVETQRANLAKEKQAINELAETKRSNLAREAEAHRSNVTRETEDRRHHGQEEVIAASSKIGDWGVKLLTLL